MGTIAIPLAKCQDVEVTGVDSALKFEMIRAIGFDHVIDYRKENFVSNGRRYDLILDTKTTRSPFAYTRSLSPGGTYATVGGDLSRLFHLVIFGWFIRQATSKTIRLDQMSAESLSPIPAPQSLWGPKRSSPRVKGGCDLSGLARNMPQQGIQ